MAETFGNTAKDTLWSGRSADFIRCSKCTSGSAGPLASITAYIAQYGVYYPKVKCAIYDASFNLLTNGTTEEFEPPEDYDDWHIFNFPTPPVVEASTIYYLAIWHDAALSLYYTSVSNTHAFQSIIYGDWPASLSLGAWYDYWIAMYATYTEVNNAPTAPTGLEVDGKSAPTGVNCISDLTPGFTAIYNDPDAGDQSNAIQIQVGTASGLSDMWDSGWLADATITPNRCAAKTYTGVVLSAGTSYWWRCRFRDDDDAIGTWSAWQQFDICEEEVPVGIGLQCVPGGPLPHRRPFTCAVRVPELEPSRRFPFSISRIAISRLLGD